MNRRRIPTTQIKSDFKPLALEFYEKPTLIVAQALLGKTLHVWQPRSKKFLSARITETEAYWGNDPASHCARGITQRCAPMFRTPGIAYVYFIYGMYQMLNFVTEQEGVPGAVLIRSVEPFFSFGARSDQKCFTNGPGKLTRALGIRMKHNGMSLQGPELWVTESGNLPHRVFATPRVGISQAKEKYWRFFDGSSRVISPCRENKMARQVR